MDYPEKVEHAHDKRHEKGFANVSRAEVPYPIDGDRWGKWEFDAESLVLKDRENGRNEYEVDLESITSSAAMLECIFQVDIKTWLSREDIGNLIEALDNLLDPRVNLCSSHKGSVHRDVHFHASRIDLRLPR